MTDFRALCAELTNELSGYKMANPMHDWFLLNRARAALAEQPVGPTDEELRELYDEMCGFTRAVLAETKLQPVAEESSVTEARAALAEQPVAIGPEWQPCVKLPITVHVREQRPGETHTSTREGITPLRHNDLIMRGVQGEEYPIGRELFEQTYRLEALPND